MAENSIESLNWDDLEQWVGPTILERGQTYRNRVHNLEITEARHLVAGVKGSEDYITHVWLSNGILDYQCSCPYWAPCKHAAAVALVYLDHVRSGTPISQITAHELDARLSEGYMDGESAIADETNLSDARSILNGMTKRQLIDWAMSELADHPTLIDRLPLATTMTSAALDKTVARLLRQIREVTSEGGWQDYWNNRGYIPDYAPIQKQLIKLLDGGHIKSVLKLGEELFTLGITQVEQSNDHGETADQLRYCLSVVFDAMGKSENSPAERMIWYWDKLLLDDYALLDGLEFPVDDSELNQTDWSLVAEEFVTRLTNSPKPKKNDARFSAGYERSCLLRFTQNALNHAGENSRAIDLLIAELPYCNNYRELVEQLLTHKEYDQAERWAREGFKNTVNPWPGIAQNLLEQLLDIHQLRKDWPKAAALQVEIFLNSVSNTNYQLAKKCCRKAKLWRQLESKLLQYLETGISPSSAKEWPLPATDIEFPKQRYGQQFPAYNDLIEISLHEHRIDDALHWFKQAPDKTRHADTIAQIAKKDHPDLSVEIWQHQAEKLIDKVKPAAYRTAMPYLRKMKTLMQSIERGENYDRYILGLRNRHKAKKRLMKELDKLKN